MKKEGAVMMCIAIVISTLVFCSLKVSVTYVVGRKDP